MILKTAPIKYFTQVSITCFCLARMSAAFISCERFYAVFWPFRHRSLSTRIYRVIIFLLWTFAVLVSSLITLLHFLSSFESSLYASVPVLLASAAKRPQSKKTMTNPLRKEVTAITCRELLSTISLGISCHPRKRTRKIEKGKKYQIRKRKKTHQIFDIQLFSRLRTVSFFGSVCGASPKK